MRRPIRTVGMLALGFIAVMLIIQVSFRSHVYTNHKPITPSIGNVVTLTTAYDNWKARNTHYGNDQVVILSLHHAKGLSTEFIRAQGRAKLNLANGSLLVEVSGLASEKAYDVWLIDTRHRAAKPAFPDASQGMLRVGGLQPDGGQSVLQAELNMQNLRGFEMDRIVVTRANENPKDATLLSGSPSLFQRLYFDEQRGQAATATKPRKFAFLIPAPAYAQQAGGSADLATLIAQGEALFFNETFDGNGRTCGTCHRADNNFTIDPAFIATLPADDPLFVAEFNDDLAELKDPTLMLQFGLIRANADGFEDLAVKFVMRSVPHMLGMSLSIQSVATEAPLEMTGMARQRLRMRSPL